MTAPRKIPLMLDEAVWGRLASIGERRGMTVSEVIHDAIADVVRTDQRVNPTRTVVIRGRLAVLNDELNAARASGWRAPQRGRLARG